MTGGEQTVSDDDQITEDEQAEPTVTPLERLEGIRQMADTVLLPAGHTRYTIDRTGLEQSAGDYVIHSYECAGSSCVESLGSVLTLDDLRDSSSWAHASVPAENLGSGPHGAFDTFSAVADQDLSVLFSDVTLTESPSVHAYGAWGQYGVVYLELINGPIAGQVDDAPFTVLFGVQH